MIAKADNGDVALSIGEKTDRVRALVKLDNYIDMYLMVGRFVDENVLSKISSTTQAANAYQALLVKQSKLKLTMTIIFTLVSLMLLLIAIWSGLALADRIVNPVTRLIQAAERVRGGDFNTRVDDTMKTEIGTLARAFNRMTDQLGTQRRDLINANRQLDERRRFSETVLAGVNAGVLGMDEKGVVQVANGSAQRLFNKPSSDIVGFKLLDLCPEMEKVRRVLRSKPGRSVEVPIDIGGTTANDNHESHWIVRMTAEGNDDVRGYVATFDDLSPLMDAQRKAAWADVARRVAHEIKNPLTPIQLSAERLQRRYSKQITEDAETFKDCTDTIIRHVDDIRHLIDEFSAFARMPVTNRKPENLVTLAQGVLVLFQQGHKNVSFSLTKPDRAVTFPVDRQQISQALTNLVKNAFEAVQDKENGRVEIAITETDDDIILSVADNGEGWPADLMPRLTDPYVTTKANGNGLGLAIVAKIVEDHLAKLELSANQPSGALAKIIFAKGENKNG
jgi:two-component system nitrogen regulation sensor histidine kinase NtrY